MPARTQRPRSAKPRDICQIECVHKDVVAKVAKTQPPQRTLQIMAEFYKVLGDPTRLKILTALAEAELCVCDIACLTGMSESAISHQLRVLRSHRLVNYRREGRIVFYALTDAHVADIIRQGLMHVGE